MELKQETVKQIRGLIIFTAVLIVCLWKFDVVISAFQFVLNIVYPFLLGGAIAFALSVPMNFVERKLFTERKISEKYKRKYARGISLMLVIAGVTGILAMIIFGLLPQLAGTFANLGKSIQEFIPQVQGWADHWFHNNKEIMNVVNNLEFDWNKIMEAAADSGTPPRKHARSAAAIPPRSPSSVGISILRLLFSLPCAKGGGGIAAGGIVAPVDICFI